MIPRAQPPDGRRFVTTLLYLTLFTLSVLLVYGKVVVIDPLLQENNRLIGQLQDYSHQLLERNRTIQALAAQLGVATDLARDLGARNTVLQERNAELTGEIQTTVTDLREFETHIQESMAWFQRNATFEGNPQYSSLNRDIEQNCLSIASNRCQINLSCLSWRNNVYGFRYIPDETVSERSDYLHDLDAIYKNRGGDCEDYSLLVNAQIRHLKSQCQAANATNVQYISSEDAPGERHYVNSGQTVYLPDKKETLLPATHQHHHIVCGSFPRHIFPDQISQTDAASFGHCLLGFSDRPLNTATDSKTFLENAILVEPQNGSLIANRPRDVGLEILTDAFPTSTTYLFLLISDRDLYTFNAYDNQYQWYGYQDFDRTVKSLSSQLEMLLASSTEE